MVMYVNWMKIDQQEKAGGVLQQQGTCISGVAVDLSGGEAKTAVAPQGARYAIVWSDNKFAFSAGANPTASATTGTWPDNMPVEVPNVIEGKTKISGVEI